MPAVSRLHTVIADSRHSHCPCEGAVWVASTTVLSCWCQSLALGGFCTKSCEKLLVACQAASTIMILDFGSSWWFKPSHLSFQRRWRNTLRNCVKDLYPRTHEQLSLMLQGFQNGFWLHLWWVFDGNTICSLMRIPSESTELTTNVCLFSGKVACGSTDALAPLAEKNT